MRFLLLLMSVVTVSACSAGPVTVADIRHYTGLSLCGGADVRDLTTREEKDTTPGYSYHVALTLDADCEASFRKQLAELPGNNCNATGELSRGCSVEDAYPKAQKHTSITVRSLSPGQYDMSFWS